MERRVVLVRSPVTFLTQLHDVEERFDNFGRRRKTQKPKSLEDITCHHQARVGGGALVQNDSEESGLHSTKSYGSYVWRRRKQTTLILLGERQESAE